MVEACAVVAGLIHLYVFSMESLLWGRSSTNRVFGMTKEVAEHNRLFAFNQGFYNLFLAIAALSGVAIGLSDYVGKTLVAYALFSMMGAGLVLLYSKPKLVRAAMIQALPPFLGLAALAVR